MQADGSVNVDGTVAVRDLNRQMDWTLPDEEATTIAGLVIHEAQTIPEPGQAFTFYGYRFEILRKSRNKITALRIRADRSVRQAQPPKSGERCDGSGLTARTKLSAPALQDTFICRSCDERDHDLIGAMKNQEPEYRPCQGFVTERGAGGGSGPAPIGC